MLQDMPTDIRFRFKFLDLANKIIDLLFFLAPEKIVYLNKYGEKEDDEMEIVNCDLGKWMNEITENII